MPQNLELIEGIDDENQPVAAFFEAFDWEARGHDAETLSAEDFLSALGD